MPDSCSFGECRKCQSLSHSPMQARKVLIHRLFRADVKEGVGVGPMQASVAGQPTHCEPATAF
eukprot:2565224-Amphidinium_carterae.1